MECSICFEPIDGASSKVILACEHAFHFGCLGKWVNTSRNESCPYCRHQMNEKEQILVNDSDEESTTVSGEGNGIEFHFNGRYIEFTYAEGHRPSGTGEPNPQPELSQKFQIPKYDYEAHVFWKMRKMFELAEAGNLKTEPKSTDPPLHVVDSLARLRKRKTPYGRTNWARLGLDYKLTTCVDGMYDSD